MKRGLFQQVYRNWQQPVNRLIITDSNLMKERGDSLAPKSHSCAWVKLASLGHPNN